MDQAGIFSWFGFELPLGERLQLIKKAGFSHTGLWLGNEDELVSAGNPDEMVSLAADAGLEISNVHAPFDQANLIWSDSENQRALVERTYNEALDYCDRHQIPTLVMHPCQGLSGGPVNNQGMKVMEGLVLKAKQCRVALAVENTRRPDYLNAILSEIDSPWLGLCYDSSHDHRQTGTQGDILLKWGSRLVETHISDNFGITDDHLPPGLGSIDWKKLSACFDWKSYSRPLFFETYPPPDYDGTPKEFLKLCKTKADWVRDILTGE